jgi:hypothetical protein
MAWTTPMTFVANAVLTADNLNEQLRDNLLETMPALATGDNGFFVTKSANQLVERHIVTQRVNATEFTQSTSYTDLTTVGPSVTFESGTDALVLMACQMAHNTVACQSWMSYAVSGATTRSASDLTAILQDGCQVGISGWVMGSVDFLTTLTPGTNTITAKYKQAGAVAPNGSFFANRFLAVWPF